MPCFRSSHRLDPFGLSHAQTRCLRLLLSLQFLTSLTKDARLTVCGLGTPQDLLRPRIRLSVPNQDLAGFVAEIQIKNL